MRTPQDELERKRLNARGRQILQQKKEGGIVRPARSDGYVNLLNKYGTKQDNTEAYHFEREPIVPDMQITGLYEGNGLFAKIIDTPAEEALKHGFDLGLNDEDLDRYVEDALDGLEWEEKATTAIKWARLYGGSIIVMLVDDGRGLEEPLDWQAIKSIDELRVYERAVVQPDYASLYLQDYGGLGPGNRVSKFGRPEFYYVSSIYGSFKVHESRCLVFRNGVLPEQVTNSTYQMWGMPEFIRIRRSLRETVTAHTDSTKLLERSVQAIYKMKGLAQILATDLGDEKVLKRLEVIDMARGILNSLVIDSDGEDYDFKTFQFSGVRDVIDACCNMLSALTNIPQTILFGRSPAGMDATGQSDLENYYNFIERIQKLMLKANLRNLLDIIFRAAVTGGELDQIPDYHLKFNPLWSMSDTEQANVEKTRADTAMVKAQTAQLYVDMQALDASEVRRKLASDDEFIVEDIISGEDDTDLLESVLGVTPEDVSGVEAAQMNEEQQQAPGGSEQSAEGSAQQTAPSVPTPAANPTQPPRPEEAKDDADAAAKDGGPGSGNWGHEGVHGQLGGSAPGGGSHNRQETETGGFTSFSKMKKAYAKPHNFTREELAAAPVGSVVVGIKGKFVKVAGDAASPDGYFQSMESGAKAKIDVIARTKKEYSIAVPDSANSNYSKVTSADESKFSAQRKSEAPRKLSEADTDEILRPESSKVWNQLNDAQKDALFGYTCGGYVSINNQLRQKGDYGADEKIRNMTEAIDKSSLPDVWLQRGVKVSSAQSFLGIDESAMREAFQNPSKLVGRTGTDKGFMSCGSTEGTGYADHDVQLHIYCPSGTKGIYAEPFSGHGLGSGRTWDGESGQTLFGNEFETVLQRGTTSRVTNAYAENGRLHIECEVIDQQHD